MVNCRHVVMIVIFMASLFTKVKMVGADWVIKTHEFDDEHNVIFVLKEKKKRHFDSQR